MSEDPNVTWTQADHLAIEIDPLQHTWHAGHVNDILPVGDDDILVATDTGGVWHIYASPKSIEGVSHFAEPLSQDWGNPDMSCFAPGPDGPLHVYAGCQLYTSPSPDRLYETNPLASDPLNAWHAVKVPADTGTIYRMAVFKATRRIVLACDGGVYWALIPDAPTRPGPAFGRAGLYQWHPVQPQLPGATGLAVGPDGTIAVAVKGSGFYHGKWQPSSATPGGFDLALASATPSNVDASQMARTSLAASDTNPSLMYAVVASWPDKDKNDPIAMVLYSKDGGQTWVLLNPTIAGTTTLLKNSAGSQGYYNNCLAVSPAASGEVVLGWQNGIYLSKDNANTWTAFGGSSALHHDVHGLVFDGRHSSQPRLYIGSDGGVIMTPNLGQSFLGAYNQYLLDLQCYSTLERNFWGTFSPSPRLANMVGTGLQDNGTVYCLLGQTPWRHAEEGDGTLAAWLQTGQFIYSVVDPSGEPIQVADLNHTNYKLENARVVPITLRTGALSGGLADPTTEPVVNPQWRNKAGLLLYALAGDNGPIYGLFAADNGDNPHWELLGDIFPHPLDGGGPIRVYPTGIVWSFGTLNGSIIFIGTSGGRFFQLNLVTGALGPMPVQQPDPDALPTRIVVVSDTLAFATYNNSTTGALLRWNGQQWQSLGANLPKNVFPNERVYGLAVSAKGELFAATDSRVYVSRTSGESWASASTGLPVLPHCAELRFTRNAQEGSIMYLSTYGRSVWQATLEAPASSGPGRGRQYTGWNSLIGSLADGTLVQLLAGGVKPVPPIDPELQKRMAGEYQNFLAGAAALRALEPGMQKQFSTSGLGPELGAQFLQAAQRIVDGAAVLQSVNAGIERAGVTPKAAIPLQQASQRVLQAAAALRELERELEQPSLQLDAQFKTQCQAAFRQILLSTAALQAITLQVQKQQG